jgi:hypothetical protein
MNKTMWWGYLHQNGTIQVKRWFGDKADYTTDCIGNEFVQHVVEPFSAKTSEEAREIVSNRVAHMETFMECAACAARPGSTELCPACLHNRRLVGMLQRQLSQRDGRPA